MDASSPQEAERMRSYIERVRKDHIPAERYTARREAEAQARDLVVERLGAFDASAITDFARAMNRDISRFGMPSSQRWGLGLSQPQVNFLSRNLQAVNALIRQLWECDEDSAIQVYQRLRDQHSPGGDMLASAVLYLRNPNRFSVFLPMLVAGAKTLDLLNGQGEPGYAQFNSVVQQWRKDFAIDPVEADIILTVAGSGLKVPAEDGEKTSIRDTFESILAEYVEAKTSQPFGKNAPIWQRFDQLELDFRRIPAIAEVQTLSVKASPGSGNWANVPWLAVSDSRAARSIRDGTYCVYLFRQDMSGVYLTLNQGVSEPLEKLGRVEGKNELLRRAQAIRGTAGELAGAGFALDNKIDLRAAVGLGSDYELSTIAHKFYPSGAIPDDESLVADLGRVLNAYLRHVSRPGKAPAASTWDGRMSDIEQAVQLSGFVFEPWQLAAYVTAVRTKPFVILAGVTGTGKTQLPIVVAHSAGGVSNVIAVRPDWTDSGDLLGYTDLAGVFRPGPLLQQARTASKTPDRPFVCVLDEMNIGRVEHYFAEVLSAMERRTRNEGGGYTTAALLPTAPDGWSEQGIPQNLVLVGTVNMDETAHGFSRKVIDRAFTLELSDVDLTRWTTEPAQAQPPHDWPASIWFPKSIRLGEMKATGDESAYITEVVGALSDANRHLSEAQLQVGYRSRDEIVLFALNATDIRGHFVTRAGDEVDPIDLAITMKVLPRIAGGSAGTRRCLLGLLGWAHGATVMRDTEDARGAVQAWETAGRPGAVPDVPYPRTAARLCLMWERLESDGFASYWL